VRQELQRRAVGSGTGFAMRSFLLGPVDRELQSLETLLGEGTGGEGFDPVPDLAALLDGVRDLARSGGDARYLADLLAGPYAALREGLRLDEPGLEDQGTGYAVYRAISAEVRWAPYQEFSSDPAAETREPPPGPVLIRATGYRGYVITLYWEQEAGP
jgi:hypothetical protein